MTFELYKLSSLLQSLERILVIAMSRLLWAQLRYFQLHHVRCRTLHSSPTSSDSRVIREKRKLQREKLDNCDHVLRLVIDCGLCKQFRMTRKVCVSVVCSLVPTVLLWT